MAELCLVQIFQCVNDIQNDNLVNTCKRGIPQCYTVQEQVQCSESSYPEGLGLNQVEIDEPYIRALHQDACSEGFEGKKPPKKTRTMRF